MWKLLYDHHTHTTFSHGKGSIEDNVKEAIAKAYASIEKISFDEGFYRHDIGQKALAALK